MKRSEMLEIIDTVLMLGLRDRVVRGEKLLESIEDVGMLPPHNGYAQKFDFTTPERATVTIMQGYKWEPED